MVKMKTPKQNFLANFVKDVYGLKVDSCHCSKKSSSAVCVETDKGHISVFADRSPRTRCTSTKIKWNPTTYAKKNTQQAKKLVNKAQRWLIEHNIPAKAEWIPARRSFVYCDDQTIPGKSVTGYIRIVSDLEYPWNN